MAPATSSYDSKGNMTFAGGTTYGYSSENLLTSSSGGASLAYDPALRLYQVSGGTASTQRLAMTEQTSWRNITAPTRCFAVMSFVQAWTGPIVWYEGWERPTTNACIRMSGERSWR